MAVEDTVLALDKALQAGAAGVPLDAYLKQVGLGQLIVLRACICVQSVSLDA